MPRMPCALAIGGLDPGGGAGVLADVRAFARAGAFGCAALTLVTIQSTAGLRATRVFGPDLLLAQAREVLQHQRVRAVKIGALGSAANVEAVAELLDAHPRLPCVVDTPVAPTEVAGPSGGGRRRARLLGMGAMAVLRAQLVPRAALVTANAPEAAMLVESRVTSVDDARAAARSLVRMGARAALVKGGHLEGPFAVDVLATRSRLVELRAPRVQRVRLHGAGCTLASLIAGRIASGARLLEAVRWAKRVHHAAIVAARDVGGALRVVVF
jgi:hydroxymethylpyrimidine kinase/phosphomethylpyrimidine kinase